MTARGSIFLASGTSEPSRLSVFAKRTAAETLVKEVVRFAPAPSLYKGVEQAARRMADGKSIFLDTVFGTESKDLTA